MSGPRKTLGNDGVAGKAFAVCIPGFVDCFGHSANFLIPIVFAHRGMIALWSYLKSSDTTYITSSPTSFGKCNTIRISKEFLNITSSPTSLTLNIPLLQWMQDGKMSLTSYFDLLLNVTFAIIILF